MSRYETYLRKIAGEDVDISNMPEPSDRYEHYLKQIAENGGGSVDPEEIAEIVTDWLDDHVDPETGYVIDNTLLVEGAAADAKKVGDELADVKSALNGIETATSNDVNKALSPKTVTNGKVTEWQYKVIGGGGGGAVDDVQINGTSIVDGDGVANILVGNGLAFSSGTLNTNPASNSVLEAGTDTNRPITAKRLPIAVFLGLARAAGAAIDLSGDAFTYTEAHKSAISSMLDAPETVSGTTPTIAAKAGVQYICGEVSTIDFTPSASGVCDVVFTSGSTPAVLTVPNTVKFPTWFDPDNLDANTTYEINVLNGVYGAVMAWA